MQDYIFEDSRVPKAIAITSCIGLVGIVYLLDSKANAFLASRTIEYKSPAFQNPLTKAVYSITITGYCLSKGRSQIVTKIHQHDTTTAFSKGLNEPVLDPEGQAHENRQSGSHQFSSNIIDDWLWADSNVHWSIFSKKADWARFNNCVGDAAPAAKEQIERGLKDLAIQHGYTG